MSGSLKVNFSDLGTVSAKLKSMFKKRNAIKCMYGRVLRAMGEATEAVRELRVELTAMFLKTAAVELQHAEPKTLQRARGLHAW